MSGLLHPVGPEDPQVYWLRRAAIVVGAVLVILVVVALGRPGGSSTMAEPSASPTPLLLATPTATPTPTPTESPTAAASGEAEAVVQTPAPAPEETPPPACAPAELRLSVAGAEGAGIGTPTVFAVQVANGSSAPCTVGWERGTAELRIFSGTDRIWSTDDCEAWFTPVPAQVVAPGESLTAEVTWQGERSYPGCKLASSPLRAGTYVATAEIDGAPAAQRVVSLR